MSIRSSSKKSVYKFVHKEDEYIQTSILGIKYSHPEGWLEINENGLIKINASCRKGYAWDGCTPKFEFLDFLIGTPDGKLDYLTEKPITYYASMVHDFFYQFKKEVPVSRKTVDILFKSIMREAGFDWYWLYYFFVRCFGGIFFPGWNSKLKTKNIRIIECSWIRRAYEEMKDTSDEKIQNHPFLDIGEKY